MSTVTVGGKEIYLGTGRRKSAVARVRVFPGNGAVVINQLPMEEFFKSGTDQTAAVSPLVLTGHRDKFDLKIRVNGGGTSGQAGAIRMGIARALNSYDPLLHAVLRDAGMLTRDSRMKERKKYGLRGARRGTQFSKR